MSATMDLEMAAEPVAPVTEAALISRAARLATYFAAARTWHADTKRHIENAVKSARAAGEQLIAAKALLENKRGEWLLQLKREWPDSVRTAQAYMQLARHANEHPEKAKALAGLALRDALVEIRGPAKAQRVAPWKPGVDAEPPPVSLMPMEAHQATYMSHVDIDDVELPTPLSDESARQFFQEFSSRAKDADTLLAHEERNGFPLVNQFIHDLSADDRRDLKRWLHGYRELLRILGSMTEHADTAGGDAR